MFLKEVICSLKKTLKDILYNLLSVNLFLNS